MRRRSSGKDTDNYGNSTRTPQTSVSNGSSRLASSTDISMEESDEILLQKTSKGSERSCSTHNGDDSAVEIKSTIDKTVESGKNTTADGSFNGMEDKNTRNDSFAAKKEFTTTVNDKKSDERDNNTTSKDSRLEKGSPKKRSMKKSEDEGAKKTITNSDSQNKTTMIKSSNTESSERNGKIKEKGSNIENDSAGEGLKTSSQTKTKRSTTSCTNETSATKPRNSTYSSKVSEERGKRVDHCKNDNENGGVKGESERETGQESTRSLDSEKSNVSSDRDRNKTEVSQKLKNGCSIENICPRKTMEGSATQRFSGPQRRSFVRRKKNMFDERRSCLRNNAEKSSDDHCAKCKCGMKKESNKNGEMQSKNNQTTTKRDVTPSNSTENDNTSTGSSQVKDQISTGNNAVGGNYRFRRLQEVKCKNCGRGRRLDESNSRRVTPLSINRNRGKEGRIVEIIRVSGRTPLKNNFARISEDIKSRKRVSESNHLLHVPLKKKRPNENDTVEDCAKPVPKTSFDDPVEANGQNEEIDATLQAAGLTDDKRKENSGVLGPVKDSTASFKATGLVVAPPTKICSDEKSKESSDQPNQITPVKHITTSFKATGLVVAPPTKMCLDNKSEKCDDEIRSKTVNNKNSLGTKKVIETSFTATGLIVAPPRKLSDNKCSNNEKGSESVLGATNLRITLNEKRNEISNGIVRGQKSFGGSNAQNGVDRIHSNKESNGTNTSSRKEQKNKDSSSMGTFTRDEKSDNLNIQIIGPVSGNSDLMKDSSNKLIKEIHEPVTNTSASDFIRGINVCADVDGVKVSLENSDNIENLLLQEKPKRQGLNPIEDNMLDDKKSYIRKGWSCSTENKGLSVTKSSSKVCQVFKSCNSRNLDKEKKTGIMVSDCKIGKESSPAQKLDGNGLTVAANGRELKCQRNNYGKILDNVELPGNTVDCCDSIKNLAKKSDDDTLTVVDSAEHSYNENINDLAHHKQRADDSLKELRNGESSSFTLPDVKLNPEKKSAEQNGFLKAGNQPKESGEILIKQEHGATETFICKTETEILIKEESTEKLISGKDGQVQNKEGPSEKLLSPHIESRKQGEINLKRDKPSKTTILICTSSKDENNSGFQSDHSGTINRSDASEASFTTSGLVKEDKTNNENPKMKCSPNIELGEVGKDQESNPLNGEVQRNTCHVAKVSYGVADFSTAITFNADSMVTESDQSENENVNRRNSSPIQNKTDENSLIDYRVNGDPPVAMASEGVSTKKTASKNPKAYGLSNSKFILAKLKSLKTTAQKTIQSFCKSNMSTNEDMTSPRRTNLVSNTNEQKNEKSDENISAKLNGDFKSKFMNTDDKNVNSVEKQREGLTQSKHSACKKNYHVDEKCSTDVSDDKIKLCSTEIVGPSRDLLNSNQERQPINAGDSDVAVGNSFGNNILDSKVGKENGQVMLLQRNRIADKEHVEQTSLNVSDDKQKNQPDNNQGLVENGDDIVEMTLSKSSGVSGSSDKSCFETSQSSTLIPAKKTGSNVEQGKEANIEKVSPAKSNPDVLEKDLGVTNGSPAILPITILEKKRFNNRSYTNTNENKEQPIRNAQEALKTLDNELAGKDPTGTNTISPVVDEPRLVKSFSSCERKQDFIEQSRQDVPKQRQNDVEDRILSNSVRMKQKLNESKEQPNAKHMLDEAIINLPLLGISEEPRSVSSSINFSENKVNLTPIYIQDVLQNTQPNEILLNSVLVEKPIIVLGESRNSQTSNPLPVFGKPAGRNTTNAQTYLQNYAFGCTDSLPASYLNAATENRCLFGTLPKSQSSINSQNGEANAQSTVQGSTGKKRRRRRRKRQKKSCNEQTNKGGERNVQRGNEIGNNRDTQQFENKKTAAGSSKETCKKWSKIGDSVKQLSGNKRRKKNHDPVNQNTSVAVHEALPNCSSGDMKIDGNDPSHSFMDVVIQDDKKYGSNENGGNSKLQNLNCLTANSQELLSQASQSGYQGGLTDQGNTVYEDSQDLNNSLKGDDVVIGGKRKREDEVVELPGNKELKRHSKSQNNNLNEGENNPINIKTAAARHVEENLFFWKKITQIKKVGLFNFTATLRLFDK